MQLGRVAGTVVATRKDEKLQGKKLLIVRTFDPVNRKETGYQVAIDTVQAGNGDVVICVSGSSARMAAGLKDLPVDTAIIGIVDAVQLAEPS